MNKIFSKFMALALSAAMIIPSVAFATEESTNLTDASELSLLQTVVDQTEPTLARKYELVAGSNVEGTMSFDGDFSQNAVAYDVPTIPTDGDGNPYGQNNAYYLTDCASDYGNAIATIGGKDYVVAGYCYSTTRNNGCYNTNNMPIYIDSVFTANDKELTIEVDYLDQYSGKLKFRYMGDSGKTEAKDPNTGKDYVLNGDGQFKTITVNVTNADFSNSSKTDWGASKYAAIRLQPDGQTALYVSRVSVYNTPNYDALKSAIDSIEIANANNLTESFQVPVSDGNVQIEWTSDNSAISFDANGNATVTRDSLNDISGNVTAKAVCNGYYLEKVISTTVTTSNADQAELDAHVQNLSLGLNDMSNVVESFTLPVAPQGFEYEWSSSNNNYIDVSDGINAVVNPLKFETSTATIYVTVYYNGKYADTEFDLSCPAFFKESKGSEVVAGVNGDINTAGDIKFDGAFSNYVVYDEATIPTDKDGNPYGETNVYFVTEGGMSCANAKTTIGDKDYVVAGNGYSTTRNGGSYANFDLPVDVGSGFTADDKQLTIEIEYLDKYEGKLQIRYINQDAGGNIGKAVAKDPATNKDFVLTGDGELKTITATVTDANFVKDNKLDWGASGKADIRLQSEGVSGNPIALYVSRVSVYSGEGFKQLQALKKEVNIEDVDLENVNENFYLPVTGDGIDEIVWVSSDEQIIEVDGDVAIIHKSQDSQLTATLTAVIIKGTSYTTKDFEVTLAKLPKQTPIADEPVVTKGETTTNIEYTINDTGFMLGKKISVMAVISDATGKIVAKQANSAVVDSQTTVVDVDIQNPAEGETLTHYVVNEIGAVIKNRAPSAIDNITGLSTLAGGKVVWDAAGDDYMHVVYDVYKDGQLWQEGIEETEVSFTSDSSGKSELYVVARDHENIKTQPSKTVSAGKYVPYYADYNDVSRNQGVTLIEASSVAVDYYVKADKKTGKDTTVQGEPEVTLGVMRTVSGTDRAPSKTYGSRMYFVADKAITPEQSHIMIVIKYFDEGSGSAKLTYFKDIERAEEIAFEFTNSKTWKQAVIEIEDAKFTRNKAAGREGCDFCLEATDNTAAIAVNYITVIPYECYAPGYFD